MAEFPDIFACVSCEKALFVDEEDRASAKYACPFCHHEHTPEEALGVEEPEKPAPTEEVTVEEAATDEPPEANTAAEPSEAPDTEPANTTNEGDVELFVDEPSEPEPEPESENELVTGETKSEGDDIELFVDEPSESEVVPEPEADPVMEEAKVDITIPNDLELPDVFACLSCDNALFLDETERKTGDFSCPHCGQKNSSTETQAVAAEQLAAVEEATPAPVAEHKFDELIECPGCEKAIKLMPEERDEDSVNCPYCKTAIAAPEPPVEEEPPEEVVSGEPESEASPEEAAPQAERVAEAETETPKAEPEEETGQSEPGATPDPEEASSSADEPGDVPPAESAEKTEAEEEEETEETEETEEGGEVDISTDESAEGESTGEEEPEETGPAVDKGLLENLIESSRNASPMPERFACPKCESEISLPEVQRQMGLCICPECEELIDSKAASENSSEEPESADGEQFEEGESPVEGEAESDVAEGGEATGEDVAEQDTAVAQEEVAAEMELWLVNVLAATADCSKCGNSLKLENKEKQFGMYRCPYCKADINHAKGAVIESLIPTLGDEEEEEEPAAKRKPINLKALLPYAAVLVFGVALNYGVITVTNYIQEKQALKEQWMSQLKADWVELEQQPDVFGRALSNASNKESLARLEEMSLDELKAFREHLLTERKEAYASWFEHTGDNITVNSTLGPFVERFRSKLNRFMRRVRLAKIDADNLDSAIGMSLFERQRARELLEGHIIAIRDQMHGLSADEAVDKALVRPELLADLMEFNLMVDQFEMQSIRQAVIHLNSMTQLANLIETQYDLNRSPGVHAAAENPVDEHAEPSGQEEEPAAHASHGNEHAEPSGHEEESVAHASHGDGHAEPSGQEEEPDAHANHGDGHAEPFGQEEEPDAHASHGNEHAEPSGHEEESVAHASHGDEHAKPSGHEEEPVVHASHGDGHADQGEHGHSSHASVKPGTLWNAEVFHWQDHQEKREQEHQSQWDEVVTEYEHLLDSLSGFHEQLKALRDGAGLSRIDHSFLHGAVLPLKVEEFQALEGAGKLVSNDIQARLEHLAKLLNPYTPGSLAYDLNAHKSRGVKLTHEQAGEFHDRFWQEWKQFHLEQQWFELEGVSSYYHLARADSTSLAKAHH